jgi:ribonuclease HII
MIISSSELSRLERMSFHEKRLRLEGYKAIAGIDEAGRGPLAGPVVAAACIIPENVQLANLNDSKQLNAEERAALFELIVSTEGVRFGIGIVEIETIDQINILQATFIAMRKAVENLPSLPDYLLIDGSQIPSFPNISSQALVKGDSLSVSIAAASILAKVTRDRLMEELDSKWPQYGFKQHKGYATASHIAAIEKWGPCPIHRKSFEPIKSILNPPLAQADLFV